MTPHLKTIRKVGLAAVESGHLLVVRKRGGALFILPGGKPEGKELDLETLNRELHEELGCAVAHTRFEGAFTDEAAEMSDTLVVVRLYAGTLVGTPQPAAEIEEMAWLDLSAPGSLPLAPSLTNHILPYLCRREAQAAC